MTQEGKILIRLRGINIIKNNELRLLKLYR